jgi:hypothetical protein
VLCLSDATRLWPGLPALAISAQLLSCADARGRFDAFENRLYADSAASGDAGDAGSAGTSSDGACAPPAPGAVSGPALLAIDTSFAPGEPILFLGTIDTPAQDGTTAVHFVYRALDSLDRSTRVGAELEVGPFALQQGLLIAPVPESTLDGDANPIVHGVPITSQMVLSGHICGVQRFYCGTLTGTTSGYISGPFTGHFGITLLDGPDAVPAPPRFGFGASAVAGALPVGQ